MGIGMPEGFTGEVAKVIIEQYKDVYPELKRNEALCPWSSSPWRKAVSPARSKQGNREFEKLVEKVQDGQIDGVSAFHLYDTYGFPVEMTEELARERGLTVDMDGFHDCFRRHQATSQAGRGAALQGRSWPTTASRAHACIPPPTCCTRRCARCWARRSPRRAPTSPPSVCALTFSFGRKMTKEELAEVERLVNEAIESTHPCHL